LLLDILLYQKFKFIKRQGGISSASLTFPDGQKSSERFTNGEEQRIAKALRILGLVSL